jgi:hypothetical protein
MSLSRRLDQKKSLRELPRSTTSTGAPVEPSSRDTPPNSDHNRSTFGRPARGAGRPASQIWSGCLHRSLAMRTTSPTLIHHLGVGYTRLDGRSTLGFSPFRATNTDSQSPATHGMVRRSRIDFSRWGERTKRIDWGRSPGVEVEFQERANSARRSLQRAAQYWSSR